MVLDPASNVYGTTTNGGNFGALTAVPSAAEWPLRSTPADTKACFTALPGRLTVQILISAWLAIAWSPLRPNYVGRIFRRYCFPASAFRESLCNRAVSLEREHLSTTSANGYGQVAPAGLPILDSEGNIYSTTSSGGDPSCNGGAGCGTVFKVNPQGQVTILHDFQGGSDGYWPMGPMLLMPDGSLYGTTVSGGSGAGTVYKIDTNGIESIVYSFTGGTDGGRPETGVIADEQGNLYGTAQVGGQHSSFCYSGGCGVVFKLTPNQNGGWTETSFYSFQGGADGENPLGGLLRDSQGNLYGTTPSGGDCQLAPTAEPCPSWIPR